MTNAEIRRQLDSVHSWIQRTELQHIPFEEWPQHAKDMLQGIDEACRILYDLNALDILEKKVRRLEKNIAQLK